MFTLPHQLGVDTGQGQEETWISTIGMPGGFWSLAILRYGDRLKVVATRDDNRQMRYDVRTPPADRMRATAAALAELARLMDDRPAA